MACVLTFTHCLLPPTPSWFLLFCRFVDENKSQSKDNTSRNLVQKWGREEEICSLIWKKTSKSLESENKAMRAVRGGRGEWVRKDISMCEPEGQRKPVRQRRDILPHCFPTPVTLANMLTHMGHRTQWRTTPWHTSAQGSTQSDTHMIGLRHND